MMRHYEEEETESKKDNQATLNDIAFNADLYIYLFLSFIPRDLAYFLNNSM